MASKNLHIINMLDGTHLQTIQAADDTKIRDVLMQCHEEGKGFVTLLRGVQILHPLEPETTVGEAGLEDGEELSLLFSKQYYESSLSTMASKNLHIISGLDGTHLQTIQAADDTKIRDVLMQCHEEGKGFVTLLRGVQIVQRLEPETTVGETGLEDGEELSLLFSKQYYETARGSDMQADMIDQYKDVMGGIYVQIPEHVNRIEDSAFEGNNVAEILIKSGVTEIGSRAFHGCKNLVRVVLPDSITSIGDQAFHGCSSLKEVVMPNSLTSIGFGAFRGCSSLTSVVIPDSITSMSENAFSGCISLTRVVLPNALTSIAKAAFDGCSSLIEVVMPKSLTCIGNGGFCGCSSLIHVVIPNSVTSIGIGAFSGCSSLTSVMMSNSLTSIGNWAFASCISLKEVVMPNSLTSIGFGAFRGCSKLTQVVIPDSVASIGERAFANCISLTRVVFTNYLSSIGDEAFHGCSSLTEVVMPNSSDATMFYGIAWARRNRVQWVTIISAY